MVAGDRPSAPTAADPQMSKNGMCVPDSANMSTNTKGQHTFGQQGCNKKHIQLGKLILGGG